MRDVLRERLKELVYCGMQCADIMLSKKFLTSATVTKDEILFEMEGLCLVSADDLTPSEQIDAVAGCLLMGAYHLHHNNLLTHENLADFHFFSDCLKKMGCIDYKFIAHELRSAAHYPYEKKPEVSRNEFVGHYEKLIFKSLMGLTYISLKDTFERDDVEHFDRIHGINVDNMGGVDALKSAATDLFNLPVGVAPACRMRLLGTADMTAGEYAHRILSPAYGVRRDFESFPSVIRFEEPPVRRDIFAQYGSSWMKEIGHPELFKHRFFDRARRSSLGREAINEYEKVIKFLMDNGVDWLAAVVNTNSGDICHSLCDDFLCANISDEDRYRILIEQIYNEEEQEKESKLRSFIDENQDDIPANNTRNAFIEAVIKNIDHKILIKHCKRERDFAAVYRITGEVAYLRNIKNDGIKRKLISQDLGV